MVHLGNSYGVIWADENKLALDMFFPYCSSHYVSVRKLHRKKPKPQMPTPTPTPAIPQKVNWWKFWTFGLACLILIGSLCTLYKAPESITIIAISFCFLYMTLALWVGLCEWDRCDRKIYYNNSTYRTQDYGE